MFKIRELTHFAPKITIFKHFMLEKCSFLSKKEQVTKKITIFAQTITAINGLLRTTISIGPEYNHHLLDYRKMVKFT